MRIWVDIDGVLMKSCQAICDIVGKGNGEDILSWDFKEIGLNIKDADKLFESKVFFDNVKLVDGAKEFLEKYRESIIIVTKGGVDNCKYKREFFNNIGFSDIPIICIPINVSKGIINMDNSIFIDDSTINLKESNATFKIQFREYKDDKIREWQKDWDGDIYYDFTSMYSIIDYILNLQLVIDK